MTLPNVTSAEQWLHPDLLTSAASHLRAAAEREGIVLADLSRDPYGTLGRHPALAIEHSDERFGGCSVFGHYTTDPPTIHVVRAAAIGRDEFTLLHEYAHHLQSTDAEWADVAWRIKPERLRNRIVEYLADEFASSTLIPDALAATITGVPTAADIAVLHQSTPASRQATLVRVGKTVRRLTGSEGGPTEHAFLALADLDGHVLFSQAIGDDVAPPPKGGLQVDVASLVTRAIDGNGGARGATSHGITYRSGNTRTDITLDVHLVHDGGYVFVVGTKERRYGTPQWAQDLRLCVYPACDNEFVNDDTVAACHICRAPKCPECRACECLPDEPASCTRCHLELTALDKAEGRTAHADCL